MNVLLLAGSEALNLKVLYCLYPVCSQVHVMANARDNLLKYSRHTYKFSYLPWGKDKAQDEQNACHIREYCEQHDISLIIPGDIGATAFLNRTLSFFGEKDGKGAIRCFPCSSAETLNNIHNKWSFAHILMTHGLATPKTKLISSSSDLTEAFAAEIGFPLIVKPLECESSHGVVKIEDYESLKNHVEGPAPYSEPPLIIQEYIPGYDIDLSLLADQGEIIAMAVQKWNEGDTLSFLRNEEIENLGRDIIRLFEFSGVAHFDMRVDSRNSQVYVIECNPRFWFTMPAAMWTGLNFVEAGIDYCTGRADGKHYEARGEYRLPGAVGRELLKRPWRAFTLPTENLKGLFQPLLDPMPHWIDYRRKS
ncbi:ATP-grasp domain-containing protein [Luteithermobacter gelatinilyticus]|uniref:ATP-grasp domain-containing protein n=1 Tax=Luteithermobacter gelatinilyticus TaxID=2582913 RepID=UPI001105C55E|nr:ATP-grasp domain-containing protein [Luteithermobacter gelatinilyticus]